MQILKVNPKLPDIHIQMTHVEAKILDDTLTQARVHLNLSSEDSVWIQDMSNLLSTVLSET